MTPLIVPLVELGNQVLSRVWPDASEAERARVGIALAEMDREVQLRAQQTAINAAEAAHRDWFVAGWRPAIGWVLASILLYSYVLQPLLFFAVSLADAAIAPPRLALDSVLWELMFGLLGLAGLRSVEKIKGTAR